MALLDTIGGQRFSLVLIRLSLVMVLVVGLSVAVGQGTAVYADTTRTIEVDAVDDDNPDGGCTLREAIDTANAGAGAGQHANGCTVSQSGSGAPITYQLNLPAYTYTLTGAAGEDHNASGDLDISASVVLKGLGAGSTILDGGGIDRVLHLDPVGVIHSVIGLWPHRPKRSGFKPSMTVVHSTIYSNTATNGGGIYLVLDSAESDIINSTITANEADVHGGGLYHSHFGTTRLINVTVTNNVADDDDDDGGRGGGVYNKNGTVEIKNTILAGNIDRTTALWQLWPDCIGVVTSNGYNLVGHLGNPTAPCLLGGDMTGTLTGTQAKLDALQDNGGATETHALLAGSPAIDHIPEGTNGCGTAPIDEDQRGVARPQGEFACDIGAYEASALLAIDKTVEPETDVAYHGPLTYTIVLGNAGVIPGSDVQFKDTLPDEVDFGHWLEQPAWAGVAGDEITWTGTVPTDTAITFVFVVSHTGELGDVVVNRAVYSHTTSSGSDEASFSVESRLVVYLPVVLRSWP